MAAERFHIDDFSDGWLVGDFNPAILSSQQVEVGLKRFNSGQTEPEHYQLRATEVTVVIDGRCRLLGHHLESGDILSIPPGVSGDFEALSDVVLLVIKSPSLPGDKVLGEGPKREI